MTAGATRRHPPRPRRLGVELRGAFGLVGTLTKYLSIAVLFPTALAIGYREPFWPFLAAGAILLQSGRSSLAQLDVTPEKTVETIKENTEMVKEKLQ